jgi:hypothetical protein
MALKELFPDPSRGCRKTTFVTNPDTGGGVILPHPFIGAMHLRALNPTYYGPTRDVLFGDHFKEFVRVAATESLKRQWRKLEESKETRRRSFRAPENAG